MGQAGNVPKMLRYDPYLRRVYAEQAFNLRNRNYGYRIALSGGIVDRELDAADSLAFVSKPFNDADAM